MSTIAKMTMVLPDGRRFYIEHDFGEWFSEDTARYMFEEGNYSCDCNKSLFIMDQYKEEDIEEFDCGDTIELVGFQVVS